MYVQARDRVIAVKKIFLRCLIPQGFSENSEFSMKTTGDSLPFARQICVIAIEFFFLIVHLSTRFAQECGHGLSLASTFREFLYRQIYYAEHPGEQLKCLHAPIHLSRSDPL